MTESSVPCPQGEEMLVGICWEHQMINSSLRFTAFFPLSVLSKILLWFSLCLVLCYTRRLSCRHIWCASLSFSHSQLLFSHSSLFPSDSFGPQDMFTSIFISHIHISLYALIKRHLGTTGTIFDLRAHTNICFSEPGLIHWVWLLLVACISCKVYELTLTEWAMVYWVLHFLYHSSVVRHNGWLHNFIALKWYVDLESFG